MDQTAIAPTVSSPVEEYSLPDETGNDLVDGYRLHVIFEPGIIKHRRIYSDRRRGIRKGIEIKRWKRLHELGRGGFGTVWLEQDDDTGEFRALKEVRKNIDKTSTMDHVRELLAMAALSKDEANFVKLYGWFTNDTHIYIAMELVEFGSLEQCIKEPLSEQEARAIICQVVEALTFMHERNFAHRDLKPSNVFVVYKSPQWWVKLADFGVSKRVHDDGTCLHTSMEGDFMSPEVIGMSEEEEASQYTNAVDMWSVGCLAHWLLTLRIPIPRRKLFAYCHRNKPLELETLRSQDVSDDAIDFITKLLKPKACDRLTAPKALEHSWPYDEGLEMRSPSLEVTKDSSLHHLNQDLNKDMDPVMHTVVSAPLPSQIQSPSLIQQFSQNLVQQGSNSLTASNQLESSESGLRDVQVNAPVKLKSESPTQGLDRRSEAILPQTGRGFVGFPTSRSSSSKYAPAQSAETLSQSPRSDGSQDYFSTYEGRANLLDLEYPRKPLSSDASQGINMSRYRPQTVTRDILPQAATEDSGLPYFNTDINPRLPTLVVDSDAKENRFEVGLAGQAMKYPYEIRTNDTRLNSREGLRSEPYRTTRTLADLESGLHEPPSPRRTPSRTLGPLLKGLAVDEAGKQDTVATRPIPIKEHVREAPKPKGPSNLLKEAAVLGKAAADRAPGAIEANRLYKAESIDEFFNAIEVPPSPPNETFVRGGNKPKSSASIGRRDSRFTEHLSDSSILDAKALQKLDRANGTDQAMFGVPDDVGAVHNFRN